jgi:dienelactone hydrolase
MKAIATSLLTLLGSLAPLSAAIVEKPVEYKCDEVTSLGWQAYENTSEKRPGVLVVHGADGLTTHFKGVAKKLADLGYNVFVADLFGKDIIPGSPETGKASTLFARRALLRTRLNAALEILSQDVRTDATKLAAVGYGLGGTGGVELARSGANLKAVVIFHGALDSPTPSDGRNIKAKILAFHGAEDPYINPAEFAGFVAEMKTYSVSHKLIKYPGVGHNFTIQVKDKSKPTEYNAEADRRSWNQMKQFLSQTIGR